MVTSCLLAIASLVFAATAMAIQLFLTYGATTHKFAHLWVATIFIIQLRGKWKSCTPRGIQIQVLQMCFLMVYHLNCHHCSPCLSNHQCFFWFSGPPLQHWRGVLPQHSKTWLCPVRCVLWRVRDHRLPALLLWHLNVLLDVRHELWPLHHLWQARKLNPPLPEPAQHIPADGPLFFICLRFSGCHGCRNLPDWHVQLGGVLQTRYPLRCKST